MKKASANKRNDDLRPEYDLTRLAGGVRGKYYRQAIAGTNLVLIEPELTHVFRDSESVNRALRLLVNTAEAAATPAQSRRRAPKKRGPRFAPRSWALTWGFSTPHDRPVPPGAPHIPSFEICGRVADPRHGSLHILPVSGNLVTFVISPVRFLYRISLSPRPYPDRMTPRRSL